MKLKDLVNWKVFAACLAASFLLAWIVHALLSVSYWATWAVIILAWIGVGITTFFDDDNDKPDQPSRPIKNP